MPDTDTVLKNDVLAAFRRVYQATLHRSMQPWLHLDLSMAQLKTLALVAEEPAGTISHVATALGITLPTASHLVDKLVRAGLVERYDDPLNRRRAIVQPSTEGAELVASLRSVNEAFLRACLARMAADDCAALLQGINALVEAARTANAEDGATPDGALLEEPASV